LRKYEEEELQECEKEYREESYEHIWKDDETESSSVTSRSATTSSSYSDMSDTSSGSTSNGTRQD